MSAGVLFLLIASGLCSVASAWNYSDYDSVKMFYPPDDSQSSLDYSTATGTHNDNIELGLFANMETLTRLDGGGVESKIYIMASANSRRGMDYAPAYANKLFSVPSGLDYKDHNRDGLKDDDGFWATLPEGVMIPYYGSWYDALWICTNGFVVMENKRHYETAQVDLSWTSCTPNIVSADTPNGVVAPYWRDLDLTSTSDAKIRYGMTSISGVNYYAVVWEKIANYGQPTKLNSFGVWFETCKDLSNWLHSSTFFNYGTIQTGDSWQVGFENERGEGRHVAPPSGHASFSKNDKVTLDGSGIAGNDFFITKIRVDVLKMAYDGSDDTTAKIEIGGHYLNTYPGGTNIQGFLGAGEGEFSDCGPILSGISDGLGVAAVVVGMTGGAGAPAAAAFLGAVGVAVGVVELVSYFFPAEYSEYHDAPGAPNSEQNAWTKNLARDECMPTMYSSSAREVEVTPMLRWTVRDESSNHILQMRATVYYKQTGHPEEHSIETNGLRYYLYPSMNVEGTVVEPIDWYGRTVPDCRPYEFSYFHETIDGSTVRSFGVGVRGYSEKNYDIMGWTPQDPFKSYYLRGDGTICIDGYFFQYDDITGQPLAGKRLVKLYVLDPSDVTNIIGSEIILDDNDPVSAGGQWIHRQVVIDDIPDGYPSVKIGIGRPVGYWQNGYYLYAFWCNIGFFSWNNHGGQEGWHSDYCIYVSPCQHGSVHSGSDGGDDVTGTRWGQAGGRSLELHPVAEYGYRFDHWENSKGLNLGNADPFSVSSIASDFDLKAVFTVFIPPQPPGPPGTPFVNENDLRDGSYLVQWSSASDPNGDPLRYELQEMVSGGSWVTLDDQITATSYAIPYRSPGTYYYQVRAWDSSGNGPWSPTSTACVVPWDELLSSTASSASKPSVAVDAYGNYHVVYVDWGGQGNDIWYKKLDQNWNVVETTQLTSDAADSASPTITVAPDGTLYVAWSQYVPLAWYQIYWAYRAVGGQWVTSISTPHMSMDCKEPDAEMDSSGRLNVVFRTASVSSGIVTEEIRVWIYGSGTMTLYQYSDVYQAGATKDHLESPRMASGVDGTMHVAFSAGTQYPIEVGPAEILYVRCSAGVWEAPTVAAYLTDAPWDLSLDADEDGHVAAVYEDWRGSGYMNIYETRSSDNGLNWNGNNLIAGDRARYEILPDMCFGTGGKVYAAWSEFNGEQYEITAKISSDYGCSWGPETRLSNAAGTSTLPAVCLAPSGKLGAAWLDDRSGSWQVYFTAKFFLDSVPPPFPNQPPVASFIATTSDLTVSVDGSASYDPGGYIWSYAWEWGDGAWSVLYPTDTHVYSSPGTYSIKLTVTDTFGARGTEIKQVAVTSPAHTLWSDNFDDVPHDLTGWSKNVASTNVVEEILAPSGSQSLAWGLHVKAVDRSAAATATSQATSGWDVTRAYSLKFSFYLVKPSSQKSRLTVISDGRVRITVDCPVNGATGTLTVGDPILDPPVSLSTNAWHTIEIIVIDPSSWEFEFKLDGSSKGTTFHMDNPLSTVDQLTVGFEIGGKVLGEAYWDDFSIFGFAKP